MVDRRHDLVKIPYVKKQTKKTAAERRERKQKMDTKSEKHCRVIRPKSSVFSLFSLNFGNNFWITTSIKLFQLIGHILHNISDIIDIEDVSITSMVDNEKCQTKVYRFLTYLVPNSSVFFKIKFWNEIGKFSRTIHQFIHINSSKWPQFCIWQSRIVLIFKYKFYC